MRPLGVRAQRWLKLLHVCGAATWVGCAVALSVNQLALRASDGRELHAKLATLDFIDLAILVPGALLCFGTGIVYSTWTQWGWFKHRWITAKWIICAWGVAFGTYPLGPWLSGLVVLADEHGLAALGHPAFLRAQRLSMAFGTFQAATLLLACYLTVFRPWRSGQERRAALRRRYAPESTSL